MFRIIIILILQNADTFIKEELSVYIKSTPIHQMPTFYRNLLSKVYLLFFIYNNTKIA